eukprot:991489-Pelagomonas_calceolata.AAC.6
MPPTSSSTQASKVRHLGFVMESQMYRLEENAQKRPFVVVGIADEAPSWVYMLTAASIVLYINLDCIDGKQARRTKTSSPLVRSLTAAAKIDCRLGLHSRQMNF